MIPILYEKNELNFASNGICRLRDAISCTVTEERNGVYELDCEFPVDGEYFNQIQFGRIISAKHDDTDDAQPFDIVHISKPINGIVSIHAVHISYRQTKIVTHGTNINDLSSAFGALISNATPNNPFVYHTDMQKTGYVAAFNGEPRSVRSILGGVEGSILDTYGGEYEWDKFNVYLHKQRGESKSYVIRYGVNLLTYNDDTDYSEVYSSIIPFWKGTDENQQELIIIGSKQSAANYTINERDETIAVDLSDKFQSQPTMYALNNQGQLYLEQQQPTLPKRSISVSFERVEYEGELKQLSDLSKCSLCDSLYVAFPMYSMMGEFKIVKTIYDVLLEKYKSMELGALPTTLSQALGLTK